MFAPFFHQIVIVGFYALFAITPLLFNPLSAMPSYEIFEWIKMLFVYALTALIVGAWVGRMISEKRVIVKRSIFDVPLFLYFLSQIIATIFSMDRYVSFFGYYSRFHGGLLSTICYLFLFYAFISNIERKETIRMIIWALISGTAIAIYGILEKFGIDKDLWVQDVQNRVFSTLGQPNWLAALLSVVIPLSLGMTFQYIQLFSSRIKKIKFGGFWIVIAVIFYVCLLFTKSRSGFLGTWASIALVSVLLPLKSKKWKESVTFLVVPIVFFLVSNFFILTPFDQYNAIASKQIFTSKIQEEPQPIQNQATESAHTTNSEVITVGVTDSADIRKIVWKGAVEIIKAYPLFGTGPETFAYAYYKYRPKEHNLTSEWDFLYNRAHNELLNIAATSGFFGLGSYGLILFTVVGWYFYQLVSKKETITPITTALLAAYVGIQITNFFGFSVVIIGVYFFLTPAIFIALSKNTPPEHIKNTEINTRDAIAAGIFGLIALVGCITVVQWFRADSAYAKSYNFSNSGQLVEAYTFIDQAQKIRSFEPVYNDQRAEIAGDISLELAKSGEGTKAASLAREAIEHSTTALNISPQNVNFWKTRTRIFFSLGALDDIFIAQASGTITIAQELAPTDPKISYNKAVILAHMKLTDEAIKELNNTIDLKPDYREPYITLASLYEETNKPKEAREVLESALRRLNPKDTEILEKLKNLK